MIEEDEFDLQELWYLVLKGDEMTIREQNELTDRLEKLKDSEYQQPLTADQREFISSVIPYLFQKRILIAPMLVEKMGLSMKTKFRYESEPYYY